ncbi:MAG: hypothetical protein MJK12_08770 [Colwellia sp.]|nr:hypothetical protein [Colwellia sp.]
MFRVLLRITVCIVLATALSSCSSMSFGDIFSSYNTQMQPVHSAQFNGDFKLAESLIKPRGTSDGTYALSLLETGRLQYLDANWKTSEQTLALAYQQVQTSEQQAKIQLSRGVENVGALVSNDSALRYDIPFYEQSMLHTYQALNYLYQRQFEGALVEVRRANLVQEKALLANQGSLFKAQQDMNNNGISDKSFNESYPSMAATIGEVKNGFQNAYTFYLSALLYEAAGELNDAYIDYKKALEIFTHNHFLQQDVLRLAKKLAMTDDLARFEQQFGQYKSNEIKNSGQLVIMLEQGIINPKEEIAINLPIFTSHNDMRFYSVALPTYRQRKSPRTPLMLTVNEQSYQSQEIIRLQSLAAKHLEDQLPSIVVRQVLRLIAKEEMRQQISRKGGDLGNILASLYNIASEKADTRSWSTLPDNVQIIRLNLAAGKHQLQIKHQGQSKIIDVEINANRISLINVNSIGNYLDHKAINL